MTSPPVGGSGGPDEEPIDPDQLTDEELAAERDELAGLLAYIPDSELWEFWMTVGHWSYLLHVRRGDPADLARAADAVERAFTPATSWPEPDHDSAVLARRLRAEITQLRSCEAPMDRELLDRSIVQLGTALRDLEATPGHDPDEKADLHLSLADRYVSRCRLGEGWSEASAAGIAVEHYRAALAAATPGTLDVALVRHELSAALLLLGRGTDDRQALEDALAEFGRAAAAREEEGRPEPSGFRESSIDMVFGRCLLWVKWQDGTQPAHAEAELNALLAAEGAPDDIPPHYLDVFGRILYERAAEQDDDAARGRAVALLRQAVERWDPEEDGSVLAAATFLASIQYAQFIADSDPYRLPDLVTAARALLALDEADEEVRGYADMMLGTARSQLALLGLGAPDPEAVERAARAAAEASRAMKDGGFPSQDESGMSATVRDVTGSRRRDQGFDRAYASWLALDKTQESGLIAGQMLLDMLLWDPHGTHVTREQTDTLFGAAVAARTDTAWQVGIHSMAALLRARAASVTGGAGLGEALAYVDRAAELGEGQRDLREVADFMRAFTLMMRGQLGGGADDIETTVAIWRRIRNNPLITPYTQRLFDGQFGALAAARAVARGDLAAADTCVATVADAYRGMRSDDISQGEMWSLLEHVRILRDDLAEKLGKPPLPPAADRPTSAEVRRRAAGLPRDHRAHLLGESGVGRFREALVTKDLGVLKEAVALVDEALELSDEGGDNWLRYGYARAGADCVRATMEQSRAPLDRGIALLERVRGFTPGPEHRLWASMGLALGTAYRQRATIPGSPTAAADRRRGRRVGLDALRGHVWAALLQSGTGHAAEAAAKATETALDVADWCLEDGVPEEAVGAVDSCRGLLLHASLTSLSVPDRLMAAGRADLAAEWRAASTGFVPSADPLNAEDGGVPSDLRRRVLETLTGAGDGEQPGNGLAALLDPPGPDEIGAALRTLGADALAYLLPAREGRQGHALVVTADDRTFVLPLPLLSVEAGPVRDYRPAGGRRDMGPPTHDVTPGATGMAPGAGPRTAVPLRKQLDRLCSWAWYAATRPLLSALGAPGRRPAVVLVPMGKLGVVPWHAAWEPGRGGARRYAVAEAAISYAASARMLCEVAGRPAAPHTGAALVVGNPTGDLRAAGDEARAVHTAFYPAGRFLAEQATPAEVLAWLRRAENAGGVLHLACHGSVSEHSRHSAYVSLAGGRLAAEELTEAGAGARDTKDGWLDLVVLAACRSHVSGRGANEAYSLATAFLVAGANSVIGSLWPVPDDATSVLMYMAHHFLRREGEPPGRALRRAQLWMLDPARAVPADMPEALRVRALAVEPDDLSAWAGFTHLGR